jgi:hypothetical protein
MGDGPKVRSCLGMLANGSSQGAGVMAKLPERLLEEEML